MPASSGASPTASILAAVSNTPFVSQMGLLTLSGLNLLQQICNAVFGVSALTLQVSFDDLPEAAATGTTATITDSSTNTWGATISGGGSHVVMGWKNGSGVWTVIGK